MAVRYACPGVDEVGHGLSARQVHLAGCCDRFAAADEQIRQETGLRIPVREFVADDDADGM